MGGEPGDHRNVELVQVIGELVQIPTIDAGIDEDHPILPAHRDGIAPDPRALPDPDAVGHLFSIDSSCQMSHRRKQAKLRGHRGREADRGNAHTALERKYRPWPVGPAYPGCAISTADPPTGRRSPVLPAQARSLAGEPAHGARRAARPGPVVRVRHLRRWRLHPGQNDRDRQAHPRASTGWRRWRTSPAWAPPWRNCAPTLDEMQSAGVDNVLALRGDPPSGPGAVAQNGGRLGVLARTSGTDRRRLPLCDRRRLLPRDAHPRSAAPRRTWNISRRRWPRACSS